MECQNASLVPNYFTCTLGEAAVVNQELRNGALPETVNELIDIKAAQTHLGKSRFACGFPIPPTDGNDEWTSNFYDFQDLRNGSIVAAKKLLKALNDITRYEQDIGTVALLCPSSPDFLFTWLGLMRAGFSVLLVAPQCQPEAIAHLCKSCNAHAIIYDSSYKELCTAAAGNSAISLSPVPIPWQSSGKDISSVIRDILAEDEGSSTQKLTSESVAYIFHTSGTSSGLPKSIPQTHRAAVRVLPYLEYTAKASFTTTPLYHGGIADCLRAWTSTETIWLFPAHKVPITEQNIISCLRVSEQKFSYENNTERPDEVKYFSSVPYILQMMAASAEGLDWLKKMDMVGVGGAALPESTGTDMVSRGVNLVSRFGSAECGFLLSSHRDYPNDNKWQYLRHSRNSPNIRFETQNDGSGLSELIVLNGWPHMAKRNREDGSLATSDLFMAHETIPNAWKYHSRSDSQITLITGRKFDPAPVEDAIAASMEEIRDVLVVGNGQHMPGALIFVRKEDTERGEASLRTRILVVVKEENKKLQEYARLSDQMIMLVADLRLEKSSKGTVLRNASEEKLRAQIDDLYNRGEVELENGDETTGKPTIEIVRSIVANVCGKSIADDDDFYSAGVDSIGCARLRAALQNLRLYRGYEFPLNVVYNCGSVGKLTNYIDDMGTGNTLPKNLDQAAEMLAMVRQYVPVVEAKTSHIEDAIDSNRGCSLPQHHVVILTGATGALGCHLLAALLKRSNVSQVYCFVRATTDISAKERVVQNLKTRKLYYEAEIEKMICLSANLEQSSFGLRSATILDLKNRVTTIIHAAWPVNFILPLSSFSSSLLGLRNLLSLHHAAGNCQRFIFCSSTASVLSSQKSSTSPNAILEKISRNPADSDKLGYSQSKWVAESICAAAQDTHQGSNICVVRVGQLCGDTAHGIWNMSEAYPLMMSTVAELGCLPAIYDMCDWLPYDIAASAIADIASIENSESHKSSAHPRSSEAEVYHVLNNRPATTFSQFLEWMREKESNSFDIVNPAVWLQKLDSLEHHPAKALYSLWRAAYVEGKDTESNESDERRKVSDSRFDTSHTKIVSRAESLFAPLDKDLAAKIWHWMRLEILKRR